MTREEKQQIIGSIAEQLREYPHYYIVDASTLNAEKTAKLRKMCFDKEIKLMVVKNTLLGKALEQVSGDHVEQLSGILTGPTAVMFSTVNKAPAVLIEEFRKGSDKPVLKAAYVEESVYVGDEQLKALTAIKSKEELIGDVISLLQSPSKNVISALQGSAGGKVAGLVKALEERGGAA
ncbi:MAG: 50S ribosomal protein L10 [Rikenellaceae bacterium]|nr:50S ribosomal protein L10 [Rikenellaceae bacterium]